MKTLRHKAVTVALSVWPRCRARICPAVKPGGNASSARRRAALKLWPPYERAPPRGQGKVGIY